MSLPEWVGERDYVMTGLWRQGISNVCVKTKCSVSTKFLFFFKFGCFNTTQYEYACLSVHPSQKDPASWIYASCIRVCIKVKDYVACMHPGGQKIHASYIFVSVIKDMFNIKSCIMDTSIKDTCIIKSCIILPEY